VTPVQLEATRTYDKRNPSPTSDGATTSTKFAGQDFREHLPDRRTCSKASEVVAIEGAARVQQGYTIDYRRTDAADAARARAA
jgi:hypothetical protein